MSIFMYYRILYARMNRKILLLIVCLLIGVALILFFIRLFSPIEIDDVSPAISCNSVLLERSDVLWVIPLYKNASIGNNTEWCNSLLALNKTIGMHGVRHTFNEFSENRDEKYVQEGVDAFEKCFGRKPDMFKAPQLALNGENKKLIEREGMVVKGKLNQILHKVYHCRDTGTFHNWFVRLF